MINTQMNYIIIETNGRKYWSMYGGGFTNDERDALKFTDSAAELRLKRILETAKNPHYSTWQGARILPVDQAVLVEY